jgi:hypothetical protein
LRPRPLCSCCARAVAANPPLHRTTRSRITPSKAPRTTPQSKEPVKVRYGYHVVADCLAKQGENSHKDVEATLIQHFNTYTNMTASKAKPFPDDASVCRHPPLRRHRH